MTRTIWSCLCTALLIVVAATAVLGCEAKSKTATESTVSPGAVALCINCGQIKGSDLCCKPGQTPCPKCGLVKGSPGCCQIAKGSDEPVAICAKCGQIKGSDTCCKPGQTLCAKCGLVEGSPGCCKLN